MLHWDTAITLTWWQIAKKLVNYVKEEVEVAKMCKQIVENGLQKAIVVMTLLKLSCKKIAKNLANSAEKKSPKDTPWKILKTQILIKLIVHNVLLKKKIFLNNQNPIRSYIICNLPSPIQN